MLRYYSYAMYTPGDRIKDTMRLKDVLEERAALRIPRRVYMSAKSNLITQRSGSSGVSRGSAGGQQQGQHRCISSKEEAARRPASATTVAFK